MKKLIQISLLFLFVLSALAQESSAPKEKILRDYDWKDLAQQQPLPGEVILTNGSSFLKIESTNDSSEDISLLKISDPAIIKKAYFLVCEIKNENPSFNGRSGLRFVCSFPPGTRGSDGKMVEVIGGEGGIFGTSNWRPVKFTVVRDALEGLPTQLEVHLMTEGRGTVYLRPIRLWGMVGSWWSEEEAPWIGAIGGPIIGCLGGLLGWLSGKGKARRLVLAVWKFCIAAGILFLIALFVALATGQPEYVSMPLFVFGIVTTTVFSAIFPTAKRRYDELEIRRMTSVDAMGS